MSHPAPNPPPRPSLLPIFILLAVMLCLIFAALRIAFPPTTPSLLPASLTPTITVTRTTTITVTPTATPTRTARPSLTLRPTETNTATRTVTVTATGTRLPTITFARPLDFNDLYRLAAWSPEAAARSISLLQSYPEAEAATVLAVREALLRYPDASQANEWRWVLAYALSRLNDPQAATLYADLIAAGLNSQQASLENLPAWFFFQEPRMALESISLSVPLGALESRGVQIGGEGGGVFLWLIQTPIGFQVIPLTSHFDIAGAIHPLMTHGDLTGDGFDELILAYTPGIVTTIVTPPTVFDLSDDTPRVLPFAPGSPIDFGLPADPGWEANSLGELAMTVRVFPACPVYIHRAYTWEGQAFIPGKLSYALQPNPAESGVCDALITQVAMLWPPEVTASLMESLLPLWPPAVDADGKPYPDDALDNWRYRLGLTFALAGQFEAGRDLLEQVAASPVVSDSQWTAPAGAFLAQYQQPEDIYRACAAAPLCDPRQAIQFLTRRALTQEVSEALVYLQEHGVAVRASGFFDFNADGEEERWLSVRHQPGQRLELWLLARSGKGAESGTRAFFVDFIDVDRPAPNFHEPMGDTPIFQLERGKGYKLWYAPSDNQAILTPVEVQFVPTPFTRDALEAIIGDLFALSADASAGPVDFNALLQRLIELAEASQFNCLNYHICDRFYYTLGLLQELSGHESEAVEAYLTVWWESSQSPYAVLARLRLKQLPAMPTRTPTMTQTLTPTISLTPTETATPDPNATPSETPTETETVVETPTQTPTRTVRPAAYTPTP